MNIKKVSILTISLIAAASSVFAWSKKSENTGNLGRMYMAIEGGAQFSKVSVANTFNSSPTGAATAMVINAPIFKPGVNAFKDIKWAGIDGQLFFNYDYSGSFDTSATKSLKSYKYGFGAALTPYLNIVTGWEYFKAFKPFAKGFVAYEWYDYFDSTNNHFNDFAYGFQGGVEVVVTDKVSFTPFFQWDTSANKLIPCSKKAGVELSFWFNDQVGTAIFWTHDFGETYTNSATEIKHAEVIGAKLKIGFMR